MKNFGIEDLKGFARQNSIDIVQLETALLKFGKNLRKKPAMRQVKNR